jgi:hypothetical protein
MMDRGGAVEEAGMARGEAASIMNAGNTDHLDQLR